MTAPRHTPVSFEMTGLSAPLCFAVVADLHDRPHPDLLKNLLASGADAILIPGDLVERGTERSAGLDFLAALAKERPVFLSLGNHETKENYDAFLTAVKKTGATLLADAAVSFRGITIGGLSTGYRPGVKQGRLKKTPAPDLAFLDRFAALGGPRLLLCHHPEYYPRYLRERDIPLILAGHAHGGQWRFFGQGIFSPGQGLFPRYTSGLYDGRLYVSRGVSDTHPLLTRIGNPREVVMLTLLPPKE